jgi:hypothetical protein
MSNANKTYTVSLNRINYYLDVAYDVAGETAGIRQPLAPSERKLCLLWATWMAEAIRLDDPMHKLRSALSEIRNREAGICLNKRKVYLREAGQVIDFS